jgi:hypothetical protein
VAAQFDSQVTPDPAAVFSPLVFGQDIDLTTYQPVGEATVFTNPIERIVAIFSYDKMQSGVQWTTLWYREGKLVYYETKPWDGNTGGYGFTERVAGPSEWQPGEYEVQIFVGTDWKTVGRFVVQGDVPTSTPTRAPSATITETNTSLPTSSPTITKTPLPTWTRAPTRTPLPTTTRAPTRTRLPTDTPWPSPTP